MNAWQILDIEPTQDEAIIRRAYSRLLKKHRPDSDPEGYQRLREAFEQAKSSAASEQIEEAEPEAHAEFTSVISAQQMDAWLASADEPQADGQLSDFAFTLTPLYTDDDLNELAALLVDDEMKGITSLRTLFQCVSSAGNLLQQQQFHNELAAALAEQADLTDGLLQRVSDQLGWGLDDYDVHLISQPMQRALEWQVRNTEREQAWKKLNNETVNGSFLQRKAVTLLLSDGAEMPFWARLLPNLVATMSQRVNALYATFPELIERLNPAMLAFIGSQRICLNWRGIFLAVFWVTMLSFLLPGAVVMSGAGWIGVTLVLFYLYFSDMIMVGLQQRKRWFSAFLILEFWFSLLLFCILFLAISFVIFAHTPPQGLSRLSGIFMFGILIAVSTAVWPKNVPGLRRPGIAISHLLSAPWRLMETLEFSVMSYPLLAVFSGFCYMLLHALVTIPDHYF
ncbi:J domain-containing protein [Pantoea sp.]|uniref:J domain-containing protein n=1 Tax=Pantoea sp. TaxID=69393 RepID=UPI0031DF544F